jgi:hypothetical protein
MALTTVDAGSRFAGKICFYRNPDIVVSQEKDKVFLFDSNHTELMVTNSVGYEIFKQCRGVPFEFIMRYVIKHYNIGDETAAWAECAQFLKKIDDLQVVKRRRREEKKVKRKMASAKDRITRR